ncbi:MAG: GNAT family N-acetyltransferase [Bacillota bacterium]
MTEEFASLISNWKYQEPYSIYSMDGSNEVISELLNGDYYYVLNDENRLVGFICTGSSARVPGGYGSGIYYNSKSLDIGLGLSPDLTGKGIGFGYLSKSIEFIKERFNPNDIQLVVASFNERAIKVYERIGFIKGTGLKSRVGDEEIDFIVMNYIIHNS